MEAKRPVGVIILSIIFFLVTSVALIAIIQPTQQSVSQQELLVQKAVMLIVVVLNALSGIGLFRMLKWGRWLVLFGSYSCIALILFGAVVAVATSKADQLFNMIPLATFAAVAVFVIIYLNLSTVKKLFQ